MALSEPCTPSGDLAVSTATLVTALPSRLAYLSLTPAAADSTVIVYDNNTAAASGTVLARLLVKASTASVTVPISIPIIAQKGLVVAVAGTGAVANLGFCPL